MPYCTSTGTERPSQPFVLPRTSGQTRHSDIGKSREHTPGVERSVEPFSPGLRSLPDASSRAESGELPLRNKVAASMDLVDRIGHLSSALSRLRRRASTSCYPADWGISPRLPGQQGIRHNDRQRADLTAGESKRPAGKKVANEEGRLRRS